MDTPSSGSTSAENQYIIDGLNTTGVELGDKGKTLNFDFVQEVEVKTGGLPAEYGRMTGGVVNVLTKSGSNVFRGSASAFGEGGLLQANDDTARQASRDDDARSRTSSSEATSAASSAASWSRIACGSSAPTTARTRTDKTTVIRDDRLAGKPGASVSQVPTSIDRDLFAAKVTFAIAAGQTLNGTVHGRPVHPRRRVFTIAGPAEHAGRRAGYRRR